MEWFSGSIHEAVAEAKRNNKLFLVYIEGSDDMSKTMSATYNDPAVAQKLRSESIIALKLVANSVPYVQFCAIYPVLVIPSSYFIGANGTPIEIVTGGLSPGDFISKIDKVFEVHFKGQIKKPVEDSDAQSSSSYVPKDNLNSAFPSTSQSPEVSECKDNLQEKVDRAKALIEAQRQTKALEEQEQEKQREIERRNVGKAIQQANLTKQDNELKEWARNRAKEKEEERLAREKVKAMIAQDRAERAARYQQTKEMEQAEKDRLLQSRKEQEEASKAASMNSNEARIQFRLPDGSFTNHNFPADSTLEQARVFVREQVRPPFSNFTLCTTFPRRHFTELNYSETLRDLQLAPSAVLLILPAQAVSSVDRGAGFLSSLFWMLVSPLTSLWRLITSLFPGSTPSSEPRPPPEVPSAAQAAAAPNANPADNSSR